MFIEAHWQCDREGCTNTISEEMFKRICNNNKAPIWFKVTTTYADGSSQALDFCSLECIHQTFLTNRSAFVLWRDTK